MKNNSQKGDTLDFTAPGGGVVSGEGYVVGAVFCVAVGSRDAADRFPAKVEGAVTLAKKDTTAFSEGDKVSWDDTGKEVVPDGDGAETIKIGVCSEFGGSASETGGVIEVKLTPNV